MIRRLFDSDHAFSALNKVTSALGGLATAVLLARALGVDERGVYAVAIS